jgi:hypothetical protein
VPASAAQLRTRARAHADQDDRPFPTDAQYDVWVEDAAKYVYAELIGAGWPVDTVTAGIAAAGDPSDIIAPGAGFIFSVQAVYKNDGGRLTELRRLDPQNKAQLLSANATAFPVYDIRVSLLVHVLYTYPTTPGTYLVEYVPDFSMASGGWHGPAESDKVIALLAASDGCRKEGRVADANALYESAMTCLENLKARASWVDQKNPAKIRDVYGTPARGPFDFDVRGPGSDW